MSVSKFVRAWRSKSANGSGRTLWQRLTGQNVKDETSLELKSYNPIDAKIGSCISFDHDLELRGKFFRILSIENYVTHIGSKDFDHTDYLLKHDETRLRLRVVPTSNESKGYRLELYSYYDEVSWDQGFWDILESDSHDFLVNEDDNGNSLEVPLQYWRVNDAVEPYLSTKTVMVDKNNDDKVDDTEVRKESVNYWDYSRETVDSLTQLPVVEYILVEMNNDTKYFSLYRGRKIDNFQLSVI